ncbi:MAG: hypothetical protein J6T38_00550 [Bacteroidaceae bacterium]|nr:hypothetical protein [Bacteroidaceae bacterium]
MIGTQLDFNRVPACVKYDDGQNYLCYNIQDSDPQTLKTYWAITYNEKAVLGTSPLRQATT